MNDRCFKKKVSKRNKYDFIIACREYLNIDLGTAQDIYQYALYKKWKSRKWLYGKCKNALPIEELRKLTKHMPKFKI